MSQSANSDVIYEPFIKQMFIEKVQLLFIMLFKWLINGL